MSAVKMHSECLAHLLHSQVFPSQSVTSFHGVIREHVLEELRGLDPVALLTVKRLIRAGLNDKNDPDAVNLRESYGKLNNYRRNHLLTCSMFNSPSCEVRK